MIEHEKVKVWSIQEVQRKLSSSQQKTEEMSKIKPSISSEIDYCDPMKKDHPVSIIQPQKRQSFPYRRFGKFLMYIEKNPCASFVFQLKFGVAVFAV
ncbi:hypothetical protein BLOT_002256 [Blomia tropicalis]|nr:hypothetical protein BLOT_002256 [Blomia tropicalis]